MTGDDWKPIRTVRWAVSECECGSTDFTLCYGEPVHCTNCKTIPDELSALPIPERANEYYLEVRRSDGGKTIQHTKTEVW